MPSLKQLLNPFLALMALTILKIIGQVFDRMTLSLHLSDISLWINSGYSALAGLLQVTCFSHCISHQHKVIDDAHFNPLIKVVSSTIKMFLFFCNYFMEKYLEAM